MIGHKLGFARRLGHKSTGTVRMGHKRKHKHGKFQQFQNMQYPNTVPINSVDRLKKLDNQVKLGE